MIYKQLETDVRGSGDRRMTFTISTKNSKPSPLDQQDTQIFE
jgi:hypothetical protein